MYATLRLTQALQDHRLIYTCNACKVKFEFGYNCRECYGHDICSGCYQNPAHHKHEMTGSIHHRQYSFGQLLNALLHSNQCSITDCRIELCKNLKQIIVHTQNCTSLGCNICRKYVQICTYHAENCHEENCCIRPCRHIKIRLQEKRQTARFDINKYSKIFYVNSQTCILIKKYLEQGISRMNWAVHSPLLNVWAALRLLCKVNKRTYTVQSILAYHHITYMCCYVLLRYLRSMFTGLFFNHSFSQSIHIYHYVFCRVVQSKFNFHRMGMNLPNLNCSLGDVIKDVDPHNIQHQAAVIRRIQSNPQLTAEMILILKVCIMPNILFYAYMQVVLLPYI